MERCGAGYLEICDMAKRIGFDSIEFVTLKTENNTQEERLMLADKIKAHCDKIGLEISAYTVGAHLIGDEADESVERLLLSLEVTARLGARIMRHDVLGVVPKTLDHKAAIAEVVPRIRRIADRAQELGITTCTENHGYVFQAPERVRELIVAVDRENYRWLCDIGNFMCADCDTVESVKIAAPYTCHVHAKDFLIKDSSRTDTAGFKIKTLGGSCLSGTVLGHGVVRADECIRVLLDSGYEGYISLEFEGREDTEYALECGYRNLRTYCGFDTI